jgi:hypothetical protein
MLGIISTIAFTIAVILVALGNVGTGFSNPLLWLGVGGAFLALQVTLPVGWGPVRRTVP